MEYVGSMVSLACGKLGDFQGVVRHVDEQRHEITLEDVFRNGLRYDSDRVIIRAAEIQQLDILMDPKEAETHIGRRATPCKQIREPEPARFASGSPVSVVAKSLSPSQPALQNGRGGQNGYSLHTPTYQNDNGSAHTPTREMEGRGSRNAVHNNRSRKPGTPNKSEGAKNRRVKEDAFADPVSTYKSTEFDFEGNNAMFNKASVYKEIEDQHRQTEMVKAGERPTKYRHDENVLASQQVNLQQIKVPDRTMVSYTTDSGLEVPAISPSLLTQLLEAAKDFGFSESRIVEMVGRSACEKVLDLLGGAARMTPHNEHQLPNVVVLCGPHIQGAMGVNCARHLANHGVKTRLFIHKMMRFQEILMEELNLYDLTEGTRVGLQDIQDKHNEKTDIVVLALQDHEGSVLQNQAWFVDAIKRASALGSQYLAINPPVQDPVLPARWYLSAGLPLAYRRPSNMQPPKVLLCDLGLPPCVYAKVGIEYVSPFSSKFVIPLDPK